jgi:uncharacterized protein (DUF302 family)
LSFGLWAFSETWGGAERRPTQLLREVHLGAYSFGVTVQGEFDDVVQRVQSTLAEEGFGVLSDIDVAGTMKKKLDKDMAPYRILGACNPPLASQAIDTDPGIGALLPCNVVVRGSDQGVIVEFMDPHAVLGMVDLPGIDELGIEVRNRLERVRDALSA